MADALLSASNLGFGTTGAMRLEGGIRATEAHRVCEGCRRVFAFGVFAATRTQNCSVRE